MIATLEFLNDYGAIVIGAVLLILASLLLPARARSYVLTGGLAVIGFRLWQIATNRRRLAAADAERTRLREQSQALAAELDRLRPELERLRQRLSEETKALAGLRERKASLDQGTQAGIDSAAALEARSESLRQSLTETIEALEAEQARFDAAAALWRRHEP